MAIARSRGPNRRQTESMNSFDAAIPARSARPVDSRMGLAVSATASSNGKKSLSPEAILKAGTRLSRAATLAPTSYASRWARRLQPSDRILAILTILSTAGLPRGVA